MESRPSTVSGSVELVLHGDAGGTWVAERGEGSSYTYEITVAGCSPDGHLTGVVESGVGFIDPEWHIGIVNAVGARPRTEDDLDLHISFYDEWEITCVDPGVTGGKYTTTTSAPALSFPGCGQQNFVTAYFDGVENYVIDCDVAVPGSNISGHISGTLHPLGGPPPTP